MADLAEALRHRLPGTVALGQAGIGENFQGFDGEVLPKATPQRLAEFRAGRQAARRAMAALGVAEAAIPMAADRAPLWPAGLVGSISHCDGLCLALVARAAQVRGLGLDVEVLRDLPAEIWSTVLRPEELQALPLEHPGKAALRYFVAKEAVYKAQYPISECLFDFQTIGIKFEPGGFVAVFMQDIPGFPRGTALRGSLVEAAGFLAAMVILT
jgi:4'-phosphopantetheinyl transferase EntD